MARLHLIILIFTQSINLLANEKIINKNIDIFYQQQLDSLILSLEFTIHEDSYMWETTLLNINTNKKVSLLKETKIRYQKKSLIF